MRGQGRRSQTDPRSLIGLGCRRWGGSGKGFYVADKLPTLRLRKLRPDRHAVADNAVGKNPKQGTWRCLLHFVGEQTWRPAPSLGHLTVAFRAVPREEFRSRGYGVGIVLQGVLTVARLARGLCQFGIIGLIFLATFRALSLRLGIANRPNHEAHDCDHYKDAITKTIRARLEH